MKYHIVVVMSLVVLVFRACAAERFSFPQLPESPYVDTEVSTNIPFSTGDEVSRRLLLSLLESRPRNDARILWSEL